ncbi:CLUMA_CG009193, isoform A [Clunio marinus]|uniref:CLUMA_CG009193, isoform A n=1 Tax=Clunio marinus TaxID=568069 RepID=A0A1J1I642_9DIPT|nr:CLUMA_CG009193, isoform A [Clunio marinus]
MPLLILCKISLFVKRFHVMLRFKTVTLKVTLKLRYLSTQSKPPTFQTSGNNFLFCCKNEPNLLVNILKIKQET